MTDYVSPRFGLVLDCVEPKRLAEFWAAALDYVDVGAAGAYVALHPRQGEGPKLLLQKVAEVKVAKNRMHIDIDASDIDVEADRLIALGARRMRAEHCHEHGTVWVLMEDPEGNEFCVCDGGSTSSMIPLPS